MMLRSHGFTLIEVVLVIFILAVLATISIATFSEFQKRLQVSAGAEEFMGVARLAQSKSIASENISQYGVYIDTATTPDSYILFKGASYALRDASVDQVYYLPKNVEFADISLGGGNEFVFERITGFSSQAGSVGVRLIQETIQSKTVYLATSGAIGLALPQNPSDDDRVTDSRHIHFDYARTINTATENIVLTFNGATEKTIPIVSNMSGGQIYWQGTVAAGGSNQTVTIQTHRLNSSDTQFSIWRDRSLNNKTLVVTISGDGSGNLANYSADGATVTHASVYVSNFTWQ